MSFKRFEILTLSEITLSSFCVYSASFKVDSVGYVGYADSVDSVAHVHSYNKTPH